MANANCGGDIDVMIAQLTIVLMVNPSHFLINAAIHAQN